MRLAVFLPSEFRVYAIRLPALSSKLTATRTPRLAPGVAAAVGLGINAQTKIARTSPAASVAERAITARIWLTNFIGPPQEPEPCRPCSSYPDSHVRVVL